MADDSASGNDPFGMARREENFLGQELHDTVCQTLQGVSLLAGLLKRAQERGKTTSREDLEKIRVNVDAAAEQLRLIFEGPMLVQYPERLRPVLERLATATTLRVPCSFTADPTVADGAGPAAYAFYRTARIFIQIAIRAGGASRIDLRLAGEKKKTGLCLSFEGAPVLSPSFASNDEKMLEEAMRSGALKWRIEGGTRLECGLR